VAEPGREVRIVERPEGREAADTDLPEHEDDARRRGSTDPDPEPNPADDAGLPEHELADRREEDTGTQLENP
jgi:hypothetical protein